VAQNGLGPGKIPKCCEEHRIGLKTASATEKPQNDTIQVDHLAFAKLRLVCVEVCTVYIYIYIYVYTCTQAYNKSNNKHEPKRNSNQNNHNTYDTGSRMISNNDYDDDNGAYIYIYSELTR